MTELASSSDEEDPTNPGADCLAEASIPGQSDGRTDGKAAAHRKRHRAPASNDDPDQATSVRVRHSHHQLSAHPAGAHSVRHTPSAATQTAAQNKTSAGVATATIQDAAEPQAAAEEGAEEGAASAALEGSGSGAIPTPVMASVTAPASSSHIQAPAPIRVPSVPRPSASAMPAASQDTTANAPAASASSQQGNCIGPDGKFIGRAAAAGLPPNIMRQTRAALGLWEQLHETASTPSTVLAPVNRHTAARTVSVGTDNSAA